MRISVASLVASLVLATLPAAAEPTKPVADQVAVRGALERQAAIVDLSRAGELSTPSATVRSIGFVRLGGLPDEASARLRDTGGHASQTAGTSHNLSLGAPSLNGVERPVAGPRALQRMNTSRALASIDPITRACAGQDGPSPAATLMVRLSVMPSGEIERADVTDRAGLRDEVISCVIAAMSGAKFRAPGGAGASMVVPVVLPAKALASSAAPTSGAPIATPPVQTAPVAEK